MRRVAIIVCTCLLLVGAAAGWGLYRADPAARRTGAQLYGHRPMLASLAQAAADPPSVVFLGDSTLMTFPVFPSWTTIAQQRFLDPLHRRSLLLATAGFDFFGYWALAGRIAALHPDVVVIIANLRVVQLGAGLRGFSDLIGETDLADVWTTLGLPYATRGLTAPRLLLARLLTNPVTEDAFLRFEGTQRDVHDAAAWSWLGPNEPPLSPEVLLRTFLLKRGRMHAAFDAPLERGNPLLPFGEAAIRKLTAAGAAVLVVVSPVPWEMLAEVQRYEPGRYARRIDVLREMTERAGGRLLDLHRALARDQFRDGDGHFTAAGAERVATLVAPALVPAVSATRTPPPVAR